MKHFRISVNLNELSERDDNLVRSAVLFSFSHKVRSAEMIIIIMQIKMLRRAKPQYEEWRRKTEIG